MYEKKILHPFHRMAMLYNYPEVESENWAIKTFTISYPKDYRAIFEQGIPAGTYVSLTCKCPGKFGMGSSCMMSDTPMEKFTNQNFLNYACGDVLIAGLGIGMLPASLAEKDDVTSITILESSQEIIDLVEPLIRENVKNAEKIKIIKADAYKYPSEHPEARYDWVYLDIWDTFPGYSEDLEMLDNIIELYEPICPKRNIDAWGYEFAFERLDNSPIEVDAFQDYLKDMMEWEERLDEVDFMGRHDMMQAAMEHFPTFVDDYDMSFDSVEIDGHTIEL